VATMVDPAAEFVQAIHSLVSQNERLVNEVRKIEGRPAVVAREVEAALDRATVQRWWKLTAATTLVLVASYAVVFGIGYGIKSAQLTCGQRADGVRVCYEEMR
jgi:hypothetical protein